MKINSKKNSKARLLNCGDTLTSGSASGASVLNFGSESAAEVCKSGSKSSSKAVLKRGTFNGFLAANLPVNSSISAGKIPVNLPVNSVLNSAENSAENSNISAGKNGGYFETQAGSSLVIALAFIAILFVITGAAIRYSTASANGLGAVSIKADENWRAREISA